MIRNKEDIETEGYYWFRWVSPDRGPCNSTIAKIIDLSTQKKVLIFDDEGIEAWNLEKMRYPHQFVGPILNPFMEENKEQMDLMTQYLKDPKYRRRYKWEKFKLRWSERWWELRLKLKTFLQKV